MPRRQDAEDRCTDDREGEARRRQAQRDQAAVDVAQPWLPQITAAEHGNETNSEMGTVIAHTLKQIERK
jgi:hypothetical protein